MKYVIALALMSMSVSAHANVPPKAERGRHGRIAARQKRVLRYM